MPTTPTPVKPEVATATYYEARGQGIPAGLTLLERETFCRGLAMPATDSVVLALQDRAASLANQLAHIVQSTGDPELVGRASRVIEKWNAEVDAFFAAHSQR